MARQSKDVRKLKRRIRKKERRMAISISREFSASKRKRRK